MRRDMAVLLSCLVTFGLGQESAAEVRVITNRAGVYETTRVLTGGPHGTNVWGLIGRGAGSRTLNPGGDLDRDLWPTIVESTGPLRHPWAVWSKLNGADYSLVYSRWLGEYWEPVQWLEMHPSKSGDNLDADLTFDASGRPYVVWWREEPFRDRVYLSVFLQTQWMSAYGVSPPVMDSRYPSIEIKEDGTILIWYETGSGNTVEQEVFFDAPVTITDDIDPLDCFTKGDTRLVKKTP